MANLRSTAQVVLIDSATNSVVGPERMLAEEVWHALRQLRVAPDEWRDLRLTIEPTGFTKKGPRLLEVRARVLSS